MKKEKILIFDVYQSNIDILTAILMEFDFKISTATNKKQFLELLNENKFDLIFYDIAHIDEQDEIKTLKKALNASMSADSLFVFTSDFKFKNADLKIFEQNFISFIQKPFNIELVKTIARCFTSLNKVKEASMKDFYDSLADFVHDLKTPLVARDYASKMLLDDTFELNQAQREILNELHLSTKYLLALTNNFLAKYKYENSKIVLSKSLRDIVLDLREVLFEIKYYAKSRACDIVLEAPDECFARYDEIGIKRIFYNLLINAVKYSPRNSEIKVILLQCQEKLTLKVENYTEEMEHIKFKNIFKKFVSCKNGCDKQGCGIGLTISKKIAKMHGGSICAKIEKSKDGTALGRDKIIFEMNLPQIKELDAQHAKSTNPKAKKP